MVYRSPTQDSDTARARAEADAFAALSPVERLAIANRASIALHRLSIAGLRAR